MNIIFNDIFLSIENSRFELVEEKLQSLDNSKENKHMKIIVRNYLLGLQNKLQEAIDNYESEIESCCINSSNYYCYYIRIEADFYKIRNDNLDSFMRSHKILEDELQKDTKLDKSEHTDLISRLYRNFGIYLYHKQKHSEAVEYLEKAVGLSLKSFNSLLQPYMMNSLGICYQFIGKLELSLKTFNEAHRLFVNLGAKRGTLICASNIADSNLLLGNFQNINSSYDEAIVFYREMGEMRNLAFALKSQGDYYRFMGQYDEALSNYEEALLIFSNSENKRLQGLILFSIGIIFHSLNLLKKSLAYYYDAFKILKELKLSFDVNRILLRVIEVNLLIKEDQKASHYLIMMEENVKAFPNPISSHRLKLATALIYKSSSRIATKFKAIELLNEIVEEETTEFSISISAMIEYMDLLLLEYKILEYPEIFTEIRKVNNRLRYFAKVTNSSYLFIELMILSVQIDITFNNIQDGMESLNFLKETVDRGFEQYKPRIEKLEKDINDFVEKNVTMMEASKPIKNQIEYSELLDYMEIVAKIVRDTNT